MSEAGAALAVPAAEGGARPSVLLPARQLLAVSCYWLGISAIWGGLEIFGQQAVEGYVGPATKGEVMGWLELMGGIVAILVQPTIGTISDYTQSRWGRRKPFIFWGALFDLVFLVGVALSSSLLVFAAFLLLLQVSSNFAQGPFQGYVPDLVPERQVGIASGAMGLMRFLGLVGGATLVATGAESGEWALPLIAIGIFEFSLAMVTVLFVREGAAPRSREGRPWSSVVREGWALDILRERSFLLMTLTRLLFLMGPSAFINFSFFYMRDAMAISQADIDRWVFLATAALGTGAILATFPAGAISNRTGRKPVIWAAVVLGISGLAIVGSAPEPTLTLPGLLLLGMASGSYLSVDWALMTEIIPRASSGRYMGLANVANSVAGPLATLIAGRWILDVITRSGDPGWAARAAALSGIVFFVGAAIALIWVRPRRDPRRPDRSAAEAVAA